MLHESPFFIVTYINIYINKSMFIYISNQKITNQTTYTNVNKKKTIFCKTLFDDQYIKIKKKKKYINI